MLPLPAVWAVLSDVSTGLSASSVTTIISAVITPIVGALGIFARWTMKQNERLQQELTEAYKSTLPVIEQCLATQKDMISVSRSLADQLAQERARPGRR